MRTLSIVNGDRRLEVVDLPGELGDAIDNLPFSVKLLCENHLRCGGSLEGFLRKDDGFEFLFRPNRLLMHDTTCTPALADVAGLRDALVEAGSDPKILSPTLPVDVSVDHSLAVDKFASPDAFQHNAKNEFARNAERYAFMKWASSTMEGVRVHPPGTGIMHTINLEQLATVLEVNQDRTSHPDMLLGTDSHTPMINGLGVLAWGIGGLEAESVMFGQAVSLAVPKTFGVRLTGRIPSGVLATDLALEVTHELRKAGVTGEFVEFFGPGVSELSADTRAVVANMAPEYGALTGYFPVDAKTVEYLKRTGRDRELYLSIEPIFRAMHLWFVPNASPDFDRSIEINLSGLSPTIAGPRRPQDKCQPMDAAKEIEAAIGRPIFPTTSSSTDVPDGAVGIAAITSCTNTSDPSLLIAAGLLARKARKLGIRPAPWVKTSLAPGSPSARKLLRRTELDQDLSALGFELVGFGCTTCIGNSGPLPSEIETALRDGKAVAAVLSGNRNFPGRVHPKLDLGYLASPPLVVAYALKGNIAGDILADPIGLSPDGQPVFLKEVWPDPDEVSQMLTQNYQTSDVKHSFAQASQSLAWSAITAPNSAQFPWDQNSTYLRCPTFASSPEGSRLGSYEARALMVLGDDITTDHISPAGWIEPESAAGKWLVERGAKPDDLNVYAAYRGNWEVMVRGLFTNRQVKNYLGKELAPSTTVIDDGPEMPVYEAATELRSKGVSSVLFAGERYGMGSSRDWAAKGVALLDVRAVIAKSFERIHRTNLIGMGVLPLEIIDGFDPKRANIRTADRVLIDVPNLTLRPRMKTKVKLQQEGGTRRTVVCRAAVETYREAELLRSGGVLASILASSASKFKPVA